MDNMIAEILASNETALCRIATLALSLVLNMSLFL